MSSEKYDLSTSLLYVFSRCTPFESSRFTVRMTGLVYDSPSWQAFFVFRPRPLRSLSSSFVMRSTVSQWLRRSIVEPSDSGMVPAKAAVLPTEAKKENARVEISAPVKDPRVV